MKKILTTALGLGCMVLGFGQNYVSGPAGLYGTAYNAATTIGSGGSMLVSTGGNWVFAGNVTSADKGGINAPIAAGRAETITFNGTGTYTGASTTAGAAGFVVDGYAAATATWAGGPLPIGNSAAAYALTVPASTAVTAAYFAGSGSTQNKAVNGFSSNGTTEYSAYYDLPAGIPAGSYTISYPAGFSTAPYSALLSSGNTSASGTSSSTAYSLLANVPTFAATASTTTATLPAVTATQLYFSSSSQVLPVTLVNFAGTASSCTANLAWATASESNSSYYAVEASYDGSSFTQVGKVASKNGATGASYAFSYPLGSGTSYFRLKMVDDDGKFAYSGTVAVTGTGACSSAVLVKVSPNPTSNVLNVQGLAIGSHLSLINVSGQKLVEVTSGGTSQSINVSEYAKGVYILRIQTADGSISNVKVVKD